MSKFRNGDRVKIIKCDSDWEDIFNGEIGIIFHIHVSVGNKSLHKIKLDNKTLPLLYKNMWEDQIDFVDEKIEFERIKYMEEMRTKMIEFDPWGEENW